MRLETYLNAMQFANDRYVHNPEMTIRRTRQYRAFRDRIIRMDERNNMMVDTLGAALQRQKEEIARLNDSLEIVLGDVDDFYGPLGDE